jgi:hypothetical protein
MGLFFDKVPDAGATSLLAEAHQQQPPPNEQLAAQQTLAMMARLPLARQIEQALMEPATDPAHAQAQAEAEAAALPATTTMKFNATRFGLALLLFAALVGAGAGTDAAHMTASSAAFFSFAGSVFGVVTAFLGTEKGSS